MAEVEQEEVEKTHRDVSLFFFCAVLGGIKQTPRSGRRFMCTERKVESGTSSGWICGGFGKGAQARASMETG